MTRREMFIEYYVNSSDVMDIDPNIWLANYIVDRMELNDEQILWFCFLNSITYHLPTAYLIINEFPDLENVDIPRLTHWWKEAQVNCPFQTDKLKQRKFLPETVESYQKLVNGSQKDYFDNLFGYDSNLNFQTLWDETYIPIKHFGRFSVWNWAQTLNQIAGYEIEPSTLLLGQKSSESHTHGLCLAFDKDEWAHKERYTDENGKRQKRVHKFTDDEREFLESESRLLKEDLKKHKIYVDNFNIETVACAYKKIFRENDSRYVGYYLDRQSKDIIDIESKGWYGVDWSLLWQARDELIKTGMNNKELKKERFKESPEDKCKLPKKDLVNEWI